MRLGHGGGEVPMLPASHALLFSFINIVGYDMLLSLTKSSELMHEYTQRFNLQIQMRNSQTLFFYELFLTFCSLV